jgi:hypothetical protein
MKGYEIKCRREDEQDSIVYEFYQQGIFIGKMYELGSFTDEKKVLTDIAKGLNGILNTNKKIKRLDIGLEVEE